MKKMLIIGSLLFGTNLLGQVCSDLFISEYVEGFANNKAIEIYNPTPNTIDLSQYMIIRYSNGATSATTLNAVQLTGTILSHDVHVGVIQKLNPTGTGVETPVDTELQAIADQFYCPDYAVSNAFYWDGNDAIMLAKGDINNIQNAIIVDIFGKIGEDPGAGWTTLFPYVASGDVVTQNHSLIRKSNILNGVVNPAITHFNPLLEYDSIPPTIIVAGNEIGNWGSLGFHSCDCSCISFSAIAVNECSAYTAPSGNIYTSSGIYTDTIPNSQGCDSLITIDFTYNPVFQTITTSACQDYTFNNETYTASGTYIDTVSGVCDTIVTLNLTIINNSSNVDICAVGVQNGNNKIAWEKPISNSIDSFNVYKESSQAGLYDLIGSTNYADSGLFTDINSNPNIQSYRYKISSVDTCGNESPLSPEHKTIHLTINQGVGQDWNLIWNHYEGYNFTTYNIYRGTNPNNLTLLTSIQSTLNSYTDQTAPAGVVYYQIEAINPNGCDPQKAVNYASSKSNIANTETSGINELAPKISVYPNPAHYEISIYIGYELIGTRFTINDIAGQIIHEDHFKESEHKVDISTLENGVYFIKIDSKFQKIRIIKQ